jgi:restriction system protein
MLGWIELEFVWLSRLATSTAWVVLSMTLVMAARAVFDARRRRAWVIKQRSLETIRRMPWADFERLVAEVFIREGYTVDLIGQGGADGGVDVLLRRGREVLLVQCKHWLSNRVGVSIAREMLGLAVHYGASGIVIVCTGGFTRETYNFVSGKAIRLVDGEELLRIIRRQAFA